MKRLYILSLALGVLVGCTDEANPLAPNETAESNLAAPHGIAAATGATTSTVRTTGFVDVTVPSPCAGEAVRMEGPVAVRIHTTVDGQGRPHQVAFYSWKDVVATGQTTGNTWHTTAAVEQYTLFNYQPVAPHQPAPPRISLGTPAVFHHTGAIRFLSDGDAPDLYVRHLVQTVIDANGAVRVDTDLFELLECQ